MAIEPKVEFEPNSFPVEEPQPAPEIYADGFHGVAVTHGVAKVTFFSICTDALSGKNKRRVALHLACPIGTLEAMHTAFGNIITNQKNQRLIVEAPRSQH